MTDTTFATRKHQVVSSLVETLDSERRDKSPKGFIDAPILELIHTINKHPHYYTTSSCSGRVAVYCENRHNDDTSTNKGGIWLYVTHDPVTIPEQADNDWIVKLFFGTDRRVVFSNSSHNTSVSPQEIMHKQMIYFKFEPLILHVEAETQEACMRLNGLAYQAGYQNSGITASRTREMLAIRSTHKIDTPIGYVDTKSGDIKCLVDPTYLFLLLHMSNAKFTQNAERMKAFEEMMLKEVEVKDAVSVAETKEERRERKRKEGLAKAATVSNNKEKINTDVDLADLSLEQY
ncbi:methyltransferase TYW3-domain-containing protein [Zychaea mexicana]|uniref:methyltransferase TYW3-domain-containing protein n=1 Tax=Zychaea mexicana TaxID=64656 RepID=UPI0022FE6FB8|nr:methyltransferase TYW3-domain-containing protein [Zychaea mexicana]KAI9495415.1 methyltransferase TYW3-domain-containing protein [Zychaea mexicana]